MEIEIGRYTVIKHYLVWGRSVSASFSVSCVIRKFQKNHKKYEI